MHTYTCSHRYERYVNIYPCIHFFQRAKTSPATWNTLNALMLASNIIAQDKDPYVLRRKLTPGLWWGKWKMGPEPCFRPA